MTLLLNNTRIGLEEIQRQAFLVIFENANNAIAQIESEMAVSDQEFANRTGRPYVPVEIERISNENFHEGHRPSLIKASIERYPNVSVWALRATPSAESGDFDQISVFNTLLYVEIMVKAEGDQGEEVVNHRVQRTMEAVNAVLMANQTLNGAVSGFSADPTVNLTDVFTRKERTSYGPEWLWQGARLEYAVRKEAGIPAASTGSFFRSVDYDIDQA